MNECLLNFKNEKKIYINGWNYDLGFHKKRKHFFLGGMVVGVGLRGMIGGNIKKFFSLLEVE